MKTVLPSTGPAPALRVEAELGSRINALFSRWPDLLGFSVHEENEQLVADLAVDPWFDPRQRSNLGADISGALLELLDEEPAARALLSGRTFARSLH